MNTTTFHGMNIHQFDPPILDRDGQKSELGDYDLQSIPKEVGEVWYWYVKGFYDGDGYALFKLKDGSYVVHYMGHCSCYGPVDSVRVGDSMRNDRWASLKELMEGITPEYRTNIKMLVKAAST